MYGTVQHLACMRVIGLGLALAGVCLMGMTGCKPSAEKIAARSDIFRKVR